MEIFSQLGGVIISRWVHLGAGVVWIGLLYYFNFVQVPAFAEFEASARTDAIRKLAPRALWWFRWGALLTFLSGLSILAFQEQLKGDYFKTASGYSISTGMLMAIIMFLNVWGVIWPNQKIVIASAEGVAAGKEPDPNAAAAARKGAMASRQNVIFSIPVLWFMVATSHFAPAYAVDNKPIYWLITLILVVFLELNALGVIGGTAPGGLNAIYDTHKNAIYTGLGLLVVFVVLWDVLFTH